MKKRRRAKRRPSLHRTVSAAAVGIATVMTINVLSAGQGRWLFTAAEAASEQEETLPEIVLAEPVSRNEELLEELIGEFFAAGEGTDEEKIVFARQFALELEKLGAAEGDDLEENARMYAVLSCAVKAREAIFAADELQSELEDIVAVFSEFERLKRSGVFCAHEVRLITSKVPGAVMNIAEFYSSPYAKCLEGTLLARYKDEFFAAALAAAAFLDERMDVLCEEVQPQQYVVYRYALGGGWESHALPEWFSLDVLDWHAHIVRREAALKMFAEAGEKLKE